MCFELNYFAVKLCSWACRFCKYSATIDLKQVCGLYTNLF